MGVVTNPIWLPTLWLNYYSIVNIIIANNALVYQKRLQTMCVFMNNL